jgi:hypothetical protein
MLRVLCVTPASAAAPWPGRVQGRDVAPRFERSYSDIAAHRAAAYYVLLRQIFQQASGHMTVLAGSWSHGKSLSSMTAERARRKRVLHP